MAKMIFVIIVIFCSLNIFGQKRISVEDLQRTEIVKWLCLDSNNYLSDQCTLGINSFSVVFFQSYFDKVTNQIRLVGRVCYTKSPTSSGLQGIGIFNAKIELNRLVSDTLLTVSSHVLKSDNNGFFDVRFVAKPGVYLVFHNSSFSLRIYDVWQAVNNTKKSKFK